MLVNLKTLELGKNNLEGTIPFEIGRCIFLEKFDISINNIEGTIPKELFNCRNLQVLNLDLNRFSGSIPTDIRHLQDLWYVRLNSNKFTGSIPAELGLLSSLKSLWLGYNELTGPLPESIVQLINLEWLVLNNNYLTGTIPDIFHHPALELLELSTNQFKGTIPGSIWECEKYMGLLLHSNDLHGNAPDDMCSRVDDLKLDDSPWFLNEPKVDCECCKKETCYVWHSNHVMVRGTARPACPSSNNYDISFNEEFWIEDHISNTTLHDFRAFNKIFSAQVCLSPLGCYTLRDSGKVLLDQDLKYSELSNSLSNQDTCGAVNICGFSFDVDHPKRKGLNHLTQLVSPDISKINDPSSAEYQSLCWIMTQDVLFDFNEICDGTLLQRYVLALLYISQQESFNFKDFSFKLTCEWPGVVCDSENTFVEELNFPKLGLVGTIMTEIGLLARLQKLDLSGNHFTGTIHPSIFGQMPHLEIVLLDANVIGGEIPNQLVTLPNLKELNISGNVIVGTLPKDVIYAKNLGK